MLISNEIEKWHNQQEISHLQANLLIVAAPAGAGGAMIFNVLPWTICDNYLHYFRL